MRMRVVDYIMEALYKEGAKHIFFVPGTGCMFLTDALAKNEDIEAISVHHEQAAGMAAISYAKYNNKLGACVVTTGCGGTNAITPLLDAWQDSVPCVFVSGQAKRNQTVHNAPVKLRQMGRQEADIVALTQHITKYSVMLNDAEHVVYEVEKAIYYAQEGRKGPSWVDVPMDIQNAIIDIDAQEHFVIPKSSLSLDIDKTEINMVIDALKQAERPIILAGNGIRLSDSIDIFMEFIEKYGIPVAYSRLGHDLIPTEHDLSIGMVGMLGASRAGNFAIQNADLVLCIGCRLSIDTTGYEYEKFAREAKIIVIDIDEEEHSKNTVKIDQFVLADAKSFLTEMNGIEAPRTWDAWREKCRHWKNHFPTCVKEYREGDKINMYHFTEALSNVLPDCATVVSDAGNTFFTVSPVIRLKKGQRSITSGCQAEMGYALPASLGISYASDCVVVAVNGDGSVMMNLQEFETLAYTQRNVKVCIMNNNGYSSIRHLQNNAFRGRQIGCDPTSGISFTDFEKLAQAFGIAYVKVEGTDHLEQKIAKIFETNAPVICEVICVEDQPFIGVSAARNQRKRFVNRPLEDQAPWLDREDFLREMIVKPIDQ